MSIVRSSFEYEHREVILRERPEHMMEISPKGTVPVLLLVDGTVIEESLEIMQYVLNWELNDDENIEIVDSHHHFWDLDKNYYPFLCDKIDPNFFLGNYEIIRQNYLPVDYEKDIINHNVIGTIHCEAEWDRNNQVGETKWIENLAKRNKFPNAIIGHAWFHTKNAEIIIAEQASFNMVKSIRSKPNVKFAKNSTDYQFITGAVSGQVLIPASLWSGLIDGELLKIPFDIASIPVIKLDLAGTHTGDEEYVFSYLIPSFARESILGVLIKSAP